MKRKAIAFFTLIISLAVCKNGQTGGQLSAQVVTPVKWTGTAEALGKDEYRLTFSATIDKEWRLCSQYTEAGGPAPVKISFEKNDAIQLEGKTTEAGGKISEGHDPFADMHLKYFEDKMICEQKIIILKDTKVTGSIEFQPWNDSHRLLLSVDKQDFDIDLKAAN